METVVYRVVDVLCALTAPLPIGTNRALLELLWMILSGRLLSSRGALIPALSAVGWEAARVRRAWAALGHGAWSIEAVLDQWRRWVERDGAWQPQTYDGYQPVAVDLTGFWRPRLQACATKHYHGGAGKALPAIPVGIIARIGRVGTQRLGLPLGLVRAEFSDPSPAAHLRAVLREAVAVTTPTDVLVGDRGFGVAALQAAHAPAYLVRLPQNFTARRRRPPAYGGHGRPPTRGELIRPLPRTYRARLIPATPPDAVTTWHEAELVIRAETWTDLILPDTPAEAAATAPPVTVVAIHDPRHPTPLLLATSVPLAPQAARDAYADRWPVEHLPLAAKQLLGAGRQFVSAPETCQRLPELALLAGSILSHLAAATPAIPTGFWDRRPQPTPGRLRRALARAQFPETYAFPARLRKKASITAHLPTGFWGQRRRHPTVPPTPVPRDHPLPARHAA